MIIAVFVWNLDHPAHQVNAAPPARLRAAASRSTKWSTAKFPSEQVYFGRCEEPNLGSRAFYVIHPRPSSQAAAKPELLTLQIPPTQGFDEIEQAILMFAGTTISLTYHRDAILLGPIFANFG